jgi:hypothetical protein
MVPKHKSLNGSETVPARAACGFGNQRLLPLPEAFAKETKGVGSAGDSEYCHQSQDASRHLRAAQVHCVNGEAGFVCDVVVSPGNSQEKERGRTKPDLFIHAFGRNLVIR